MIIVDLVSGTEIAIQNVTERLMNALIRRYLYAESSPVLAAEGGWSRFGVLWDVACASDKSTRQLAIKGL